MGITLPKQPVKATRISPKVLVMYSLPKVGKTDQLTQLSDCLILDTEGGTEMYDCLKVPITSTGTIDEVVAAIMAEGSKNAAAGKQGMDLFPYKFIAIDTLDKLEDLAEVTATRKYKASVIGKNFDGKSVLELPKGLGYYYLRVEIQEIIAKLKAVCPRLILVTHIKDKLLVEKDGTEVSTKDISLTGKLSSIVCGDADAIAYLYRKQGDSKLWVSFETYDGAVMGARQKYLAGQKMEFSWKTIYPDVFGEPAAEKAHLNGVAKVPA